MADLLAKWLNEEIKLSTRITDFEKDFSSGYLLGELLYKFNQQDNFSDFSTKDNVSSKVKNFEKLEPTLRNLNIKFDSQQVDKIMKQERGYALRLLYQLKMILEKVYPPTDIAILRKTGKVGDNQPALKIGPAKDTYNKMQSTFFKTRLQALNKPQKTMNMENHLKKFGDEAKRQAAEADQHAAAEADEKERIKQEIRRAQINKLQRNAGFLEEWLAKGVEDWKQNMAYKKEREQSQLEFEYKQAQKFNEMTVRNIDDASREVNDGIEQFEETLKDNGINPRVTAEDAAAVTQTLAGGSPKKSAMRTQKLAQSLLSRPTMGLGGTMTKTGGVTLASVGLRSKAKKPLDEKARKDRERRRMRMITDQMGLLQDMEKERRETEVIQRMKRQAKQEEELAYEAWRTTQCRAIIVEDRKLREAKYDKRQDLDTQNAIFKEKQMLDSMQEQMTREIETLKKRDEFMREKDKEAKKLRQTVEAAKMIDAIFDIANEAYIHQQKQDSDEIDPRNWHEWEQLFIEGAPIVGETSTQAESEEAMKAEGEPKTPAKGAGIDHLELVDYLETKGQWPATLVSENKPDIAQILSGAGDAGAPAAAKGKAPPKGAPADAVALDESEMQVGDAPENNFFVGDAVEQIINLNYEARGRQLRPKNPHYLNLKLCFVGYAFAGKKLQAMKLKQEYGLDSYTLNDLVEQALDFFRKNPDPIVKEKAIEELPIRESLHEDSKEESKLLAEGEAQPEAAEGEVKEGEAPEGGPAEEEQKQTVLRENPMFRRSGPIAAGDDEDAVSEASEIDEELNAEEDFRVCGEKIQKCLFEGAEIPDQLYVDLYVAKLRMTYEYKDREAIGNAVSKDAEKELELQKSLGKLQEELREMRDPDSKVKRKKKRTPEVVEKEIQETNKELEGIKALAPNGWILIDFPTNFSQAMLLEKALSGYVMPGDLEPTQREIESKEAQLLVKPTEKPAPPKTLIPSGIDAVIWFDCSRDECLRRALGRRIDSQSNVIYHIQDNPPSIEKSPLCEVIESIDDESESMACLIDRWVAFDQTRSGLDKWLTQFGDEDTNSNLLTRIEASGDINSVYDQIDSVLKTIVENKMKKQTFLRSRIQATIIEREEIEEAARIAREEEEEAKRKKEEEAEKTPAEGSGGAEDAKSAGGKTGRSIAQSKGSAREGSTWTAEDYVPDRSNIDDDFKSVLMTLWKKTALSYKSQMIGSLKKQRVQRENIQQYLYNVQIQFLTYLRRQDSKQQVLDKFVEAFNEFSDQYPDMREDDQTKEELHQRVDILSDELWEIAEERKEQAIEERKKIMESGWVEFSLEYLTSCAQQMMQSEIDKFKGTIQLTHDYYHAVEEKLIPEAPETVTVDLMKEDVELPEVERLAEGAEQSDLSAYSYPRLDDLYKKALKAQVVPDVLAAAAQADAGKAKGKKDAGKGKPAEEEAKPESIYVTEMKSAIKIEKGILRFRLTQIRNWALNRLKHQREKSQKLYQKLDDWILVSSSAENAAIDEICDVIKEAIEDQSKIQDELRIKFMDFFVDKGIANYIEPPPEKLPEMEQAQDNKFNIPQLNSLVQELTMLGDADDLLANRDAVELLVRKAQNSRSLGDIGGLPKDWSSFNRNDFEKLVRNLDIQNIGKINYKDLATCCILLQSSLPTADDIASLQSVVNKDAENQQENFKQGQFWYKVTEAQQDREYSHPFPRVESINQILFDLHSVDGRLDAQKLGQALQLTPIIAIKTGVKTYSDVLINDI